MENVITPEVVSTIDTLREELNIQLVGLGATELKINVSDYEKALTFVKFNDWLKSAKTKDIEDIADKYGLLPVVISLTGIDVTDVTLLQRHANVDLMGHIRYLNCLLNLNTNNDGDKIIDVGTSFFGEDFEDDTNDDKELRSKFISCVLEYFINTSPDITYDESIWRLLSLVD